MATVVIKKQRSQGVGFWMQGMRYVIPERAVSADYEIEENGTTKYIRTTNLRLEEGTVIDLDKMNFSYRDANGNVFAP